MEGGKNNNASRGAGNTDVLPWGRGGDFNLYTELEKVLET